MCALVLERLRGGGSGERPGWGLKVRTRALRLVLPTLLGGGPGALAAAAGGAPPPAAGRGVVVVAVAVEHDFGLSVRRVGVCL